MKALLHFALWFRQIACHLRLLLFSSSLFASFACSAQNENNNWVLGNGMAIDMSSGSPQAAGSASVTVEGAAAQSGKDGRLKFYSDGFNVYNRNHKVMPNGAGLITDGSMTQGVAIVPHPDDTSLFYVCVLGGAGAIQLRYSVVDMRLDKGMGDVSVAKNIMIDDSLSEKMLVTRGEGCSYWLMVHSGVKAEFHAFRIASGGLLESPVVSTTSGIGDGRYGIGEMKVAPNNRQLVLANWRSRGTLASVELFNFDSSTGGVSGYTLIDSSYRFAVYGISFSPDGTKLYAAYGEDEPRPPYALIQYDLDLLPDLAALRATRTTLASGFNWAGMRLHRDKVYVIKPAGLSIVICSINQPNKAGLACSFKDSILVFGRTCFSLGNPVPETPVSMFRRKELEVCSSALLHAASGYRYYVWNDGSSDSVKVATPPATIWVTSSSGSCAASVTDTFLVRSRSLPVTPAADVYSCRDTMVTLVANTASEQILWSTGSNTDSVEVRETGYYSYVARSGDCEVRDTIFVKLGDCDRCLTAPNAFTPNGDGRNDYFRALVSCPLMEFEMRIFNRYGQQIFISHDLHDGWDGRFKGTNEDLGTYFYLIRAKVDRVGQTDEILKGDVTLLR